MYAEASRATKQEGLLSAKVEKVEDAGVTQTTPMVKER